MEQGCHDRWRDTHRFCRLLGREAGEVAKTDDLLMPWREAVEGPTHRRLFRTEHHLVRRIGGVELRCSLETVPRALAAARLAELARDLVRRDTEQPWGKPGFWNLHPSDIPPRTLEHRRRDVVGDMYVSASSDDKRPDTMDVTAVEHAKGLVVVLSTCHERPVALVVIEVHRYTVCRIGARHPVVRAVQNSYTVSRTPEVVNDDGRWVHRRQARRGVT